MWEKWIVLDVQNEISKNEHIRGSAVINMSAISGKKSSACNLTLTDPRKHFANCGSL